MMPVVITGCGQDPSTKTDAELGLNAQQARGRRVYQVECASCHSAYSSKLLKGPTMMGLYKKEYLPSGLLASDNFVAESIIHGRKMMPSIPLTREQLQDVIAYLHTL